MIKPSAILGRLLPCCAAEPADAARFQALLDDRHIGLLSAACCDTTAAGKDEGLRRNLQAAMERCGDGRTVVVETITAAQQHMRTLDSSASPAQRQLIQKVVALFQSGGLSIFPLLIVDGRVAFYGGVPSVEMIEQRLRPQVQPAVSN